MFFDRFIGCLFSESLLLWFPKAASETSLPSLCINAQHGAIRSRSNHECLVAGHPSMDSGKNIASKLFSLTPVEAKDELDERYERCYSLLLNLTSGVSEKKAHDALNEQVCKGAQSHEDISLGLVIGILTDATGAAQYYRDLTFLTRDGLAFVLTHLSQIISEKYLKLSDNCRTQLLWVLREMIKNSVTNCDTLCFNLLRQIAGGDVSTRNMWLADKLLDVFIENRPWLEKYPVLLATSVYTYLRLIVDHGAQCLSVIRLKEVDYCSTLLKEKFSECMMIGRDLVRLLQNVARIPEFEKIWKDMLLNPTNLAPTFTGVLQLLTSRTSRRFLQCRLTPDMERKIVFLTSQVKFGQQKRYQDWFQKQYLTTPESQSLRCDLIRFICGVIHPSNEALCSDVIPRWAVIGWLLTTCTSNVAASNAKLSLFYDWLFFDPEKDNIMNIEPAILVMYHSMRPHPAITATLLDFLCRIMPNFCVSLAKEVKHGIFTSLRQILEKRVLPSLSPLFDNPKLDRELRAMICEAFSEFCSTAEVKPEEVLPPGKELPPIFIEGNHSALSNNITENEAQFSEDEDDIPLGKLKIKETKFRPIEEPRSPKAELVDVSENFDHLSPEIQGAVLNLKTDKDNESRCESMEKLLQFILSEDAFNQDMAYRIGMCLASILSEDFSKNIFPQEVDEESVEDSIGLPLFVMLRNLCQTPEEDPSRQPLLMILSEIANQQPRLGYLLLYFLKASRIQDEKMSSYRDYVKSFDAKELPSCLLSDLRLCQEDDVRLFCYLIPDIYIQFHTIAIGNAELLNIIVSCIDSAQLQDLICHILQGNMIMFKKDSFLSVLNASLEWETFEQFCLWQLIMAHNIPVDYVLPILPKLEFHSHAEALTSILLLLKQVSPTEDLLRHILCREVKARDQFVVSVLKYWCQEHEEKLADMIGTQLGKAFTFSSKRKRQPPGKSQIPPLEQTLAHLDHLRQCLQATSNQSSKQPPLFSQDAIQAALLQVQQCCTEAQKSRFSDLFALAEDLEDVKTTKPVRSSGRGKGGGNLKNSSKSKPAVTDSETEYDSSGDEDIVRSRGPRKKKKTSVVNSDSD